MLRSINELTGYHLSATDAEIGKCKDFLFDDRDWVIRYMVADTHKWLPGGREVLISPIALDKPDWCNKMLPVNMTRQRIEDSPPLEEHAPVSREYEINYFKYYGYGYYWMGPELWGTYPQPAPLIDAEVSKESDAMEEPPRENHLRSANEVQGYNIQATDDDIGHVEDFLLDHKTWAIEYLVIDTRNWLPGGRKVIISPEWLESVDWIKREVQVSLTARQIKDSPPYDPELLNPDYERALRNFYGFRKSK